MTARRLAAAEDDANLLPSGRRLLRIRRADLDQRRIHALEVLADDLLMLEAHRAGTLMNLQRIAPELCQRLGQVVLALDAPLLKLRSRLHRMRDVEETAHLLDVGLLCHGRERSPQLQLQREGDVPGCGALLHVELHGARNTVCIQQAQLRSDRLVRLVGEGQVTLELHQGLADDRLVLALPALDDAERGDGHAATLPLLHGRKEVLDGGDKTGETAAEEVGGRGAQRVAVGGVEDGRQACTAFVAVGMELRREVARVGALLAALLELRHNGRCQQLLGLDLGHLYVSVGVAVEQELRSDEGRQVPEGVRVLGRQRGHHSLLSWLNVW
mmetsp:Transcript_45559/g.136164  ORF Transcript_45559/g.136164 Transcript_45559/m.136164 type:complete len:328 (-) Transcript_45559:819-1802(-)